MLLQVVPPVAPIHAIPLIVPMMLIEGQLEKLMKAREGEEAAASAAKVDEQKARRLSWIHARVYICKVFYIYSFACSIHGCHDVQLKHMHVYAIFVCMWT